MHALQLFNHLQKRVQPPAFSATSDLECLRSTIRSTLQLPKRAKSDQETCKYSNSPRRSSKEVIPPRGRVLVSLHMRGLMLLHQTQLRFARLGTWFRLWNGDTGCLKRNSWMSTAGTLASWSGSLICCLGCPPMAAPSTGASNPPMMRMHLAHQPLLGPRGAPSRA